MIRKPPADWQQLNEGVAVRTVRTAAVVAKGSANAPNPFLSSLTPSR